MRLLLWKKQRDVAMAHIETWLKEVEQHLNVMRVQFRRQYPHERQNWQKKISLVLKNQVELQKRFEEVLQNLQQGQTLESIPRIVVPSLPQAPALLESLAHPRFMPPPEPIKRPLPPQGHFQQQQYPPPQHPQYHQRYRPPTTALLPPSPSLSARVPGSDWGFVQADSSPKPPPHLLQYSPPHPAAPSPPPPVAASATSILEKLGTRFPQYNTTELKTLPQAGESSRGTLAGHVHDEATEQIQSY
ncbi:RING finger protein 214 isoform X2 [Takifugu rubripes]|uniref:RING finger protein 214 isoform X2 n=1 Tax=Takifugu rubripes TaxID=31033 RepID=UPI0011454B53|nr:RING finger protein 214-like isoform X2 [Takifugu rubripes]